MIYKEIVIKNSEGLKAKAAANFVQVANQFDSQILIEFTNKKINAKSIETVPIFLIIVVHNFLI